MTASTPQNIIEYTDLIEKYRSAYGDRWTEQDAANAITRVQRAVEEKDFSYLVHLRHTTTNQFSREVFTRVTGVKLHRTQRESLRILETFVGPEKTTVYYQDQAIQRAARETERLKRQVGTRLVSAEGFGQLPMDEFIETLIQSGYTSIVEHPRGGAKEWFLFNEQGRGYTFRRSAERMYIESLLAQRQAVEEHQEVGDESDQHGRSYKEGTDGN